MKDQLNDHMPKPDSWDKILGKMNFENQLAGHIQNLPQFEPNNESWEKINAKLQDKKRILIWPYLGIAAGIIGILLISKFAWNDVDDVQLPISDQNSLTEITAIDLPVQIKFQEESKTETSKAISSIPKPKKITDPPKEEPPEISIEVPDFEFIAIDTPLILPAEKDSITIVENQNQAKTLHEVTISWGLKPSKFKVKTGFGNQDPSKINSQQTGSITPSRRIRIGQRN